MHDLKRRADEKHQSVSGLINEIVRAHLEGQAEQRPPFRQRTHHLGARAGINFHKSLDLAAEMETDYTIDKLEIGK